MTWKLWVILWSAFNVLCPLCLKHFKEIPGHLQTTWVFAGINDILDCVWKCIQINFTFTPAETEQVSLSHLQLAQSMKEEAKKLEEFREKQKEARKKVCLFINWQERQQNMLTGKDVNSWVVFLGWTVHGRSSQAEILTVQKNNGCKYKRTL